ncbi:MAG: NAD-dependent epimerase/dehydratase family protein [bacterium]
MDAADFQGRKVMILGGLGFIGSNLALRLVEHGAEVTLVDSMLPQYGGNLANIEPFANRVRVNFSDIRDRFSLSYLVRDAEYIFSLAGQTSHIDSMTDPFTDLDVNCISQLSLLECCRHANPRAKIVYTSTRQIYGRPQYLPVDESHPLIPADVNGINKLAAEQYYTLYSQVYGMQCVSLRLTNTYGPRQHVSGNKQGFVGIFVRKAIDGEGISIFGDGQQVRDFNYVDDVVDALMLAARHRKLAGQVFNLGAPDTYSLYEFVELLHDLCDFSHELVPFPPDQEAIDIGDYYGDYRRFQTATGWEPRVRLPEGLAATVAYFRERKHQYW